MQRSTKKQTYADDREQYGYTIGECAELTISSKPHNYKKCSTCHRIQDKRLFLSQYSNKEIKLCNFCQCGG